MGVPSHKRVSFAMVSATSINNSIFEVGFHLEMSTLKVAAISSGVLKGAKFLIAFHASRFLCHRSPRAPSHSLCDNLWCLAACPTCISKKHGLLHLHSSMELSWSVHRMTTSGCQGCPSVQPHMGVSGLVPDFQVGR